MSAPEEKLWIEDGILYCPEDIISVPPEDLKAWCKRLLECEGVAVPKVDLSRARQISSQHIGILADTWARSLDLGREMRVRVSVELSKVFKVSGFDQVFKIEVDE